jgi:hypothetical protein
MTMKKLLLAAMLATTACNGSSTAPSTAVNPRASVAAGLDWLTEKVCADASNTPVAIDPVNGCPGYTERDLLPTDTVPYYRTDGGADYAYGFPVTGPANETMYVMAREFAPQNQPANWYVTPSYFPGHSHWDLYRIQNAWVSNAATRDVSGLNQIFFGNTSGTATPYNGWIDFPVTYLSNPGATQSTNVPVSGLYWEEQGLPWPVPAQPAPTSLGTQTTWQFNPAYTFASGKQLATIISEHQSAPNTTSHNPDNGHMEIWYFTQPYGPSRWEVWAAEKCLANSCSSYIINNNCTAVPPSPFPYGTKTYTYYRTNCRDWTVTAPASPGSTVPPLPIPQANILSNPHFSDDPVGTAGSLTAWQLSASLTGTALVQQQSTAAADTGGGKYAGARYAQIVQPGVLTQTVSAPATGATVTYGASVKAATASGSVTVTFTQLDGTGAVLATATSSKTVTPVGDNASCTGIVVCATFVGGRTALATGAASLQIQISLDTSGITYDLVDSYIGNS